MSVLVILSLCTRDSSNCTGGGGKGSICVIGLSTVHLSSTILHGTPITHVVDGFCVTPVVSHSRPHSKFVCGFILFNGSEDIGLANTFSPNGTNSCIGFWPCNLSNDVRLSRSFWQLDKMLPACPTNRGKIGGVFSEFFLCAALHMLLDGSDDTAQSTSLRFRLESLSPLTASSDVTTALQFSATRSLNTRLLTALCHFSM